MHDRPTPEQTMMRFEFKHHQIGACYLPLGVSRKIWHPDQITSRRRGEEIEGRPSILVYSIVTRSLCYLRFILILPPHDSTSGIHHRATLAFYLSLSLSSSVISASNKIRNGVLQKRRPHPYLLPTPVTLPTLTSLRPHIRSPILPP